MSQTVPVGPTTQVGLGLSLTAFAGSVAAFVANGPGASTEGVVGAGVGVLLALAVIAGRYAQSLKIVQKAEAVGTEVLADAKTDDPNVVSKLEAAAEKLIAAGEQHLHFTAAADEAVRQAEAAAAKAVPTVEEELAEQPPAPEAPAAPVAPVSPTVVGGAVGGPIA